MPLMTTKPMFDVAYDGGFAIGAFNVNNMEITQGIISACADSDACTYSSSCTQTRTCSCSNTCA